MEQKRKALCIGTPEGYCSCELTDKRYCTRPSKWDTRKELETLKDEDPLGWLEIELDNLKEKELSDNKSIANRRKWLRYFGKRFICANCGKTFLKGSDHFDNCK